VRERCLERAVEAGDGEALFGETFDPNTLDRWSGPRVTTDIEIAREFYERALIKGVQAALVRLKALD
jgi:hypothetical protein